ncbi:MAG TPA: hypothetical protein VIL16_13215 [Trebonia sp.]
MLIAAAACVPVLIIAYALTTSHSGRAVDTSDVTGVGLQPAYGHGARAGGWGKGGHTMMPGAVTFTDALIDNDAIGSLNTDEVTMESAGNVAEATPSALTDGDEFTVTADAGGAASTTGTAGGHRHHHQR